MKKTFYYTTFLLLVFAFLFSGCKKGENDPFLSLHSRKSRITGEWKLTSGKRITTDYSNSINATTVITTNYDGANASQTETTTTQFGSSTTSDSYSYTDNITIKKDGSFTGVNVDDGESYTFEGNWNFEGGVGETKNKSKIILFYTKIISSNGTTNIGGNSFTIMYDLLELRTKKMVWILNEKTTYANGDYYETNTEFTYEQ